MKPNMFIDFDGTIVDNKNRLFSFFMDNIPPVYKDVISIEDFWIIKRLGIHEIDWLNLKFNNVVDKIEYDRKKIEHIEDPQYLKLDCLLPDAKINLRLLNKKYNTILVSRRSKSENLKTEIENIGIVSLFDDIIVVPHNGMPKDEYLKQICAFTNNDIFVGDTEDDLFAGRNLGIKTYFVLTGIRERWILEKYHLNNILVVNSLSEIL